MAELESDQVSTPSLATAAASTATATPPAMPATPSAPTPNLANLAAGVPPTGGAGGAQTTVTSEPYPALRALDAGHFGSATATALKEPALTVGTNSASTAGTGISGAAPFSGQIIPVPPIRTSLNLGQVVPPGEVRMSNTDEVALGGKG